MSNRIGWLGALAIVTCASTASAYEVKTTPKGAPVHWVVPNATFHLDRSIDRAAPGARDAIKAAAQAWSGLDGAPTITIEDDGGGSKPGYDGKSTIFFAPEGSELAGGALAITILTFNENGNVLDADIIVNGRFAFGVLDDGARPGADAHPVSNEGDDSPAPVHAGKGTFDLRHVVAHEFGHALGLADEAVDPGAVMYLYTSPGDASRRAPVADDASGIASLYASTADGSKPAGCGASVSPRTPSTGAPAVFALALGAWLTRTRRRDRSRRTCSTGPCRTGGSCSRRCTRRS